MTIRDPETLASSSTGPSFNGGEHLAHDIEELVIAGRTCDFGPYKYHTAFLAECTKRQIKQLFKATEKTLIANGFEWPRGNCHVQRKLQAKSMVGAVHAATVARRDVSIA
jgi:hypothetical protein